MGHHLIDRRPRVIIIGAGFAGIQAAKALKGKDVDVLIFDKRNHHLFQPLLYQVATAALAPSDIAHPIRRIFRSAKNISVAKREVTRIDLENKQVVLPCGSTADYDALIVAVGSKFIYFGHEEWSKYAPGLKSVEDALAIRRRMLTAFEQAEWETDPKRQRALMTFVIIGGGPTGVELAGTMRDVAMKTLDKDFRRIDPSQSRVILVEANDRILKEFHEENSASAYRQLVKLGVEIHKNTRATQINGQGVQMGDQWVEAFTVVWAAGVVAADLTSSMEVPRDRGGRVEVEPDLSVPGHPEVYVVGDAIRLTDDRGVTVPGLAPAAMQTGKHAAKNLLRRFEGKPTKPFVYVDKGSMATIGRNKAVADVNGFRFSGFPAWLAWMFVHVFFLVDFRNKMTTLIEWGWSYVTHDRGARLVTGEIYDPVLQDREEAYRQEQQRRPHEQADLMAEATDSQDNAHSAGVAARVGA